jgi:hypothetical protein
MTVVRRVLLVSLGVWLGCGGDGDGAGAHSGVASAQKLGELSSADAKQLCEWASSQVDAHSFEPTKEQACTIFGVGFTDNPTECQQLVDACVAAPEQDDAMADDEAADDEPDCDDAMVDAELMGCSATVAEYEACVRAAVDAIEDVFSNLSCAEAGMTDLEDDADEQEPEACKALEIKCPGVFEDEDSD